MKTIILKLLFLVFATINLQANILEKADDAYGKEEYKKAFKMYGDFCTKKNDEACFKVAFMYENKQGIAQDLKKAYGFYEKACDFGNGRACFKVGVVYHENGLIEVEKDFKKAEKYYIKACEDNYALGCFNLGDLYQFYISPEKNKQKAISMYEKSCQLGKLDACYKAANMYEQNKKNIEAKKWYKIGCDRDDRQACYRLVDIIIDEIDKMDQSKHEQYLKEFEKGCNNKDTLMCFNLGVFHATGRGTKQSYLKAKEAYGRGCDLGSEANCLEYAILYDMGF